MQGLLTFLQKHVPPARLTLELDGAAPESHVVALDFTAFSLWIFQECYVQKCKEAGFDLCIVSNYMDVRILVAKFAGSMRRYGLTLEAFSDGARGAEGHEAWAAVSEEVASRGKKRYAKGKLFQDALRGWLSIGELERQGGEVARPELFAKAVGEGLGDAGVQFFDALGEADALICQKMLDAPGRYIGVFGNDSDFAVARGSRLIPYELFGLGRAVLRAMAVGSVLPAAESIGWWSPELLAKELQIDPSQLPAIALLLGNDLSRSLLSRLRSRGLQLPQDVHHLVERLAGEASPTLILEDYLEDVEDEELATVWRRVRRSYAYDVECAYKVSAFSEEIPPDCPLSRHLHQVAANGGCALWTWPVRLHGLFVQGVSWQGPKKIGDLLWPLFDMSFTLLREDGQPVSYITVTESGIEEQVWMRTQRLNLLRVLKLDAEDRAELWRRAAAGDVPSAIATATARLKRNSNKVGGSGRLLKRGSDDEGTKGNNPGLAPHPNAREIAVRLTLRLVAKHSLLLEVTAEDFDALTLMAWLLLQGQATCIEPPGTCHNALDKSPSALVLVGERYQHILRTVADLGEILGLSEPGRRLVVASEAFDGSLLRRLSSAGSDGSDAAGRLYEQRAFDDWRREVLHGLPTLTRATGGKGTGAQPSSGPASPAGGLQQGVLPITLQKGEVLAHLRSARVVCIRGATGCGKSTQVPQYLLELGEGDRQPNVIVTQPRRTAAVQLAKRVAAERGESVGQTVAFAVGGGESVKSHATRLTFVTTGWLLQFLVHNSEQIRKFTHVVLDEVHERSVDADMLSFVLKVLLSRCPNVSLVIMSATLDDGIFQEYFKDLVPEPIANSLTALPTMDVGQRPFSVQEVFLDDLKAHLGQKLSRPSLVRIDKIMAEFAKGTLAAANGDALGKHVELSEGLIIETARCLAKPGCTVLVFLPGLADISNLFAAAQGQRLSDDGALKLKYFGMHSEIPKEDMEEVFEAPDSDCAHIVFASNIAESSLTLPSVTAVLDIGLHRRLRYDPRRRAFALHTTWTSRASGTQRSGRAGRTMNGVGVRLYTRSFHSTLARHDKPDILEAPIPKLYLQAKELANALEHGPNAAIEVLQSLPQPPDMELIEVTIRDLATLGAITEANDDAELSPVGSVVLSLPFDLASCRLVWLGTLWGCAVDAVVMACCLGTVQDPFMTANCFSERTSQKDYAWFVRRSCEARHRFDRGLYSEPLMLRALFIEWWRTRPTKCMSGFRSWAQHSQQVSRRYAVHARRMTQMVCAISDAAGRAQRLCRPGSRADRQLRELLDGLGVDAGAKQRGSDWTSAWEREDGEGAAAPEPSAAQRWDISRIFELRAERLQGLLAAALSDRLIIGRLPKKAAKGMAAMASQGLDPVRSVAMPKLPVELKGRATACERVLSICSSGATFEVKLAGGTALASLGQSAAAAAMNDEAEPSTAGRPVLSGVPVELYALNCFAQARKEFEVFVPGACLESKSPAPGLDDSDDDVHFEWLPVLVQPGGHDLLLVIEYLAESLREQAKLSLPHKSSTKRVKTALHKLITEWSAEVAAQRGVQQDSLGSIFFTWLAGMFVVQGKFASKAKDFELGLRRSRQEVRKSEASASSETQPVDVPLQFGRDWVQHPCKVAWQVVWNGSNSADSGKKDKCMALLSVRNPVGFACHVPSDEDDIDSFCVLGCCGGLRLLQSPGFAIVESFSALRLEQLPFWLMTAPAHDADLKFGFNCDSDSGLTICAIKAFGEELPCNISPDIFMELSTIRARLRSFVMGTARGSRGTDDAADVGRAKGFVLDDCDIIRNSVNKVYGALADVCAEDLENIDVAWCHASPGDVEQSSFAQFWELEKLHEAAVGVSGGSARISTLRGNILKLLYQVKDERVLDQVHGILAGQLSASSSTDLHLGTTASRQAASFAVDMPGLLAQARVASATVGGAASSSSVAVPHQKKLDKKTGKEKKEQSHIQSQECKEKKENKKKEKEHFVELLRQLLERSPMTLNEINDSPDVKVKGSPLRKLLVKYNGKSSVDKRLFEKHPGMFRIEPDSLRIHVVHGASASSTSA